MMHNDQDTPLALPGKIPAVHIALLLVFAALHIAAALGSAGTSDTGRDLYFARQIDLGNEWPLSGPGINATIHLGPLWYYLLAAVMFAFDSSTAVVVVMGVLSALQFPLAYLLGRRVGGNRLAIVFAAALMLPGWCAFPLVSLTHTTVVVTAMLFGALACWRFCERPDASRAVVFGLALALMLHAHPTTVTSALALVLCALFNVRDTRLRLRSLVLFALPALVLFAPMVVDQIHAGLGDAATLKQYAATQVAAPSALRFVQLATGLLLYGGDYVARYWLELPHAAVTTLFVADIMLMLIAVFGLVASRNAGSLRTRLAVALAALFLVQTMVLEVIRPFTPFWMTYTQLPVIAALVALGLDAALQRPALRAPIVALFAVLATSSAAGFMYIARAPHEGLVDVALPGERSLSLMDVKDHQRHMQRASFARVSVGEADAIAEKLCTPVTLYAHYARFVDDSYALGALRGCGTTSAIRIGGAAQGEALIGLRDYVWDLLALQPERRIGTLGISTPHAIWHARDGLSVTTPHNFPPRTLAIAPEHFSVHGETADGEAVVVANRAAMQGPFDVAVKANGSIVAPLYLDMTTQVFKASGAVSWDIEINGTPAYVDILTVTGKAR
jgi:hypothetical protein